MERKEYWNKKEMGWWEKVYLFEIARGLWVTFSVSWMNLWRWMTGRKGCLTVYYPEETRPDYATTFRGRHYLPKTETGRPKCIACKMCANICPAVAIAIDAGNAEPGDTYSPKIPTKFDVDLARCIFCGHCVDICPKKAILMSKKVPNFPGYDRASLLLNKESLLEFVNE